jgi:Arc/MetJ-type ribon-helix-helix transcriptional regulator
MRTTLNISMPPKLFSKIEAVVSEQNYSSISEFIRDAIRAWEDDQLYRSVLQSEKEFAQGKGKRLRSLKDLM